MRIRDLLPMPARRAYRQARDVVRAAARDLRAWNYNEADVKDLYAGQYHHERGYAKDSAEQLAIKAAHAEFVARHAPPGRIVEAGCSNGELVRQLRQRGRDAWGFDITTNLDELAYPEIRPFLRQGSLLNIPFGAEEGFSTLVALDVFEHIPRRSIPAMVDELKRLRVSTVVTLINHVSVADPGHISLFPLVWWRWALSPTFRLRPQSTLHLDGLPQVYGLDSTDPVHVLRVWDRK